MATAEVGESTQQKGSDINKTLGLVSKVMPKVKPKA